MNNTEHPYNKDYIADEYRKCICPKCGSAINGEDRFCPLCGCKIKAADHISQNKIKVILIISGVVIAALLATIVGLVTSIRYTNTAVQKEQQTELQNTDSPDVTEAADKLQLINEQLNEVKRLYDSGDYKSAQKKLYSINEEDMNDSQKDNYRTFEMNIESKLSAGDDTGSVKHAGTAKDYSNYDNSLSKAYIIGAESGNVYFWNDSSGEGYTATIPNGTTVYTTGKTANGRTLIKWNGDYGWVTSKFLNIGSIDTYSSSYHIQGASSGSVYVWKYPDGDEYYATISNGTKVNPTGIVRNNRAQIYWGNGYAWITLEYIG